ncbi:hypothetical protein [Ornithinibacillus sp. JPR2-1]|uniref:hypothetical protein n=1 Tax=Ornithinibacillus sp. JPR2-1 TaxID=2094019 RepID=UPI0031CE38ED
MKQANYKTSPEYEDYVTYYLFTIFFGLVGLLIFGLTHNFTIIFIAIITGVLIDILKFAVIVFATIQGNKTVDNEKIHTEEIGENENKIEEKPK